MFYGWFLVGLAFVVMMISNGALGLAAEGCCRCGVPCWLVYLLFGVIVMYITITTGTRSHVLS